MSLSTKDTPLWKSLSLKKHAVIEASAGTGKTFTIEHLVLRLLLSEPPELINNQGAHCNLQDILLVTFTEKAAGELKERVRKKIESVLRTLFHYPKSRISKKIHHV